MVQNVDKEGLPAKATLNYHPPKDSQFQIRGKLKVIDSIELKMLRQHTTINLFLNEENSFQLL